MRLDDWIEDNAGRLLILVLAICCMLAAVLAYLVFTQ